MTQVPASAMTVLRQVIRPATSWLHPSRPPLNGQQFRQRLFRSLIREFEPQAVFESGTYYGDSTQFLWNVSGRPVHTVEKNPGFAR
ncbi:hypothetical protein ABZO31_04650 [Streptomyces sp. HUAS MG47]|uniref:hypothetical protein n=1 Tax=Streptomyces solicamelliae TaxID=3231716 RepID=UPI003877E977